MTYQIKRQAGTTIAEFAPCFCVIILMLIALLNLLSLVVGASSAILSTDSAARHAAAAHSQEEAESSLDRVAKALVTGPIGKFSHLKQIEKFKLTAEQSEVGSNTFTDFKPANGDDPGKPFVDEGKFEYQYRVSSTFEMSPFLNMCGFGPVSGVPGLGKPLSISCSSVGHVEHPAGLKAPGDKADSGKDSQSYSLDGQ